MRILVGKCFGIGNACLSIPMMKALASFGDVDVLVGMSPDDLGAFAVFEQLKRYTDGDVPRNIWIDAAPLDVVYDVAVMAIPFDGRWKNHTHFEARRVVDGRRRPGDVDRLGFDMWKKHEAEYQLDNARELGMIDETVGPEFIYPAPLDKDLIFLGIGYKRDPGGFGSSKHYGTDRFIDLVKAIRSIRPAAHFITTGGMTDLVEVGSKILAAVGPDAYRFEFLDIRRSFDIMARCDAYVGNDTGAMHVCSSLGMPTMGLMAYEELITKNPPLRNGSCVFFNKSGPCSEEVARKFVDWAWRMA